MSWIDSRWDFIEEVSRFQQPCLRLWEVRAFHKLPETEKLSVRYVTNSRRALSKPIFDEEILLPRYKQSYKISPDSFRGYNYDFLWCFWTRKPDLEKTAKNWNQHERVHLYYDTLHAIALIKVIK